MKSIWIIECVQDVEACDDFSWGYSGEVCTIFHDTFFMSFEEAWNHIKDYFNDEKPEYCHVFEDKHEIHWKHCDDDWWTYRIKELKRD